MQNAVLDGWMGATKGISVQPSSSAQWSFHSPTSPCSCRKLLVGNFPVGCSCGALGVYAENVESDMARYRRKTSMTLGIKILTSPQKSNVQCGHCPTIRRAAC